MGEGGERRGRGERHRRVLAHITAHIQEEKEKEKEKEEEEEEEEEGIIWFRNPPHVWMKPPRISPLRRATHTVGCGTSLHFN
jgi:hypothetical protein